MQSSNEQQQRMPSQDREECSRRLSLAEEWSSARNLLLQPSTSIGSSNSSLPFLGRSSFLSNVRSSSSNSRSSHVVKDAVSPSVAAAWMEQSKGSVVLSPQVAKTPQHRPSAIRDAARITDWETVYDLCNSDPQLAQYSGSDGWTALHHAANRRCPLPHVVDALIRAHNDAVFVTVDNGWLPLHYACRFKAPTAVVKLLVDAGPSTVSQRDISGRTALYYALRYQAPPGVVELLVQTDPQAILQEDRHEESPLTLLWDAWAQKVEGRRCLQPYLEGNLSDEELRQRLMNDHTLKTKWDAVEMLLRAAFGFPIVDRDQPCTRTWRIVHAISVVKCHISLFHLACRLYPQQVQQLDRADLRRSSISQQNILHLAVAGQAQAGVVRAVLQLYPTACQQADSKGQLPLHGAARASAQRNCSDEWYGTLVAIHTAFPSAVEHTDVTGRLPLHWAAINVQATEEDEDDSATDNQDDTTDNEADDSILIYLLRAYAEGAALPDSRGFTPFHLACRHVAGGSFDSTLEALYQAHPAAVSTRDTISGRWPLHLACANIDNVGTPIVRRLVELYPQAASLPDAHGQLPLHIGAEMGKDWEQLQVILQAFPDAIHTTDARGWFPLHQAAASRHANHQLIQLLQVHHEAARIADTSGRYPLHWACASAKSSESLEQLYAAWPEASRAEDVHGLLPFHITASTSEAPLDCLYMLIRNDPTLLLS